MRTSRQIPFVLFIVLLGVLWAMNPRIEQHRRPFASQAARAFSQEHKVLSFLGLKEDDSDDLLYHDAKVFSYTTLHGRLVSFGIAGKVFARDYRQVMEDIHQDELRTREREQTPVE
ncbi:MAG TPA: hypothetical protein VFE05_14690 [Longimicrobiaceae bacterium]|jgi:hypothetical protein|nr:hypothetical protein [Longimicrobiaceae bacterium]